MCVCVCLRFFSVLIGLARLRLHSCDDVSCVSGR